MKMDIACPVELLSFEQAEFGETRRQAYLTFLNESPHVITAISGRLALLNPDGRVVEERRISFGQFAAPAGRKFICHLALDGYPAFASATMIIEDVLFESEEPWALHPMRLMEFDPPVLKEGPERVALVSVAGEDAVCYPQKDGSTWLCVCGRYNRWRWANCRRCRRERDATLAAFHPQAVQAAYANRVQQAKNAPPRVLVDGAARKRARVEHEQKQQKEKRQLNVRNIIITAVSTVLVAGLLIWGITTLVKRMPAEVNQMDSSMTAAIEPDFLEAIQ